MRPKAEWAIHTEAIRVRGVIFLVKIRLVHQKNIKTKLLSLVKARQNAIQPPLFWFSKLAVLLLVGYNIYPSSSSANQNAALIIDH